MPLPEPSPVPRVCLSDAAYDRLRGWIIDGTLAAGEPLRDEALAEALGMSRTPVRDALQRLENEGLVVTGPTRRTTVSPVTLKQARELYPIAAALEALALRLAFPRLDEAALTEMREANAALVQAIAAGDAAAATEADEAAHHAFITRCGNDALRTMLDDTKCKVARVERAYWDATDRTGSVADHNTLIAALASRDLGAAERTLARNWDRSLEWILPKRG